MTLSESTIVKARTFNGSTWSALSEALFTVDSPLRVTEIMYNPDQGEEKEFVEVTNTSATRTVSLVGVHFADGLDFVFDSSETDLAPGESIVVVRNQAAFAARYDTAGIRIAAGQFDDTESVLANEGETLRLEDAAGGLIQEFTYSDDWYKETDGDDFSLIAIDPAGDFNDPANWRSSALLGGSPGEVDPTPIPGDFNGDGSTTRADVAHMLSQYGRMTNSHRFRGDFDLDGATSLIDLVGVQNHLGESLVSSPAAPASTLVIVSPGSTDPAIATTRAQDGANRRLVRRIRDTVVDSAAARTNATDQLYATWETSQLARSARAYRTRATVDHPSLRSSDDR